MKSESLFTEFKPALRFLSIFVAVYLAGNIVYGLYVEWYKPLPDPATVWISQQTAFALSNMGRPVYWSISEGEPVVLLKNESKTVLRIFEGCNGLNVVVVFASFVIAFGGRIKSILVFLLVGGCILHISNLVRVVLLYYTALHKPTVFYYFHKYFFTAVLYVVVFALWILWTRMRPAHGTAQA